MAAANAVEGVLDAEGDSGYPGRKGYLLLTRTTVPCLEMKQE